MKIAFFTESYKPYLNGAIVSISHLKKELEKRGHIVYLFTSGKKTKEKNVFYCPKISIEEGYGICFPYYKQSDILKKVDILHTHQPFVLGLYAKLKSSINKKPLLATYHTVYHNSSNYVPVLGERTNSFIKFFVGKFINSCNKVIIPTPSVKKIAIDEYKIKPEKIEMIPTGLSYPLVSKLSVDKLKKNLKIKDKKVLTFCGRLGKEKDVEFIIESFKHIHEKDKQTVLFIIGKGPLYKKLNFLIKKLELEDSVSLVGEVKNKKVMEYFALTDIYLSASKSETQGFSLLEAMFSKCVPVIFSVPGFVDVVTNNKNAVFVSKRDTKIYAKAVLDLLSNKKRLEKMKKQAQIRAKEFRIEKTTDKLEKLYKQLIKEKKN